MVVGARTGGPESPSARSVRGRERRRAEATPGRNSSLPRLPHPRGRHAWQSGRLASTSREGAWTAMRRVLRGTRELPPLPLDLGQRREDAEHGVGTPAVVVPVCALAGEHPRPRPRTTTPAAFR